MALIHSLFIFQIAAFSFSQAALMFSNHRVPGTKGKKAACEMPILASKLVGEGGKFAWVEKVIL